MQLEAVYGYRKKGWWKTRELVRQFFLNSNLFNLCLVRFKIKSAKSPERDMKIPAKVSRIIKRINSGLNFLLECQYNLI